MNVEIVDINDYSKKLIDNREFLSKEYQRFINNCYSIQGVSGIVSNSILKSVINKAFWNKKLRGLLSGILWYANKDSITDEIFRLIMKFPSKDRNTYIDVIAHAELAYYQFQMIYKATSSWEAFAWLFYNICKYDIFKEEDMLQLLRDNVDITYYGIQDCIDWAKKEGFSNPKLDLAQTWANSMCVRGKSACGIHK